MADPEDVLADSPADFDSSFAYALHPEMRRLLIITIVGSVLLPVGLSMFAGPSGFASVGEQLLVRSVGLLLAVVGAAFLYGGVVGALFKVVTDANIVANEQ